MVEKLKDYFKKSFSNSSPKAKIIITTIAVAIVITATIMSARKTLTISIDGKEESFVTYKWTVKDVLQDNGIEVTDRDKVEPSLDSKVSEKELITIKKAIPVNITLKDKTVTLETAEDTIGEMLQKESGTLKEQGVEFEEGIDEVSPSLDTKIGQDLNVKIVNVETKDIVENKDIEFDTVIQKDSSLDSSAQQVKNEGTNGEKQITYKVTYKDGEEVSREIKSTKVIAEPVNKIIVKGTGNVYASRGAGNITYKRKLSVLATAYSGHSTTATGRRPVRNSNGLSTIAVDPSVIPLGSKVYVEGYGYAIAADTGGAIKGNKIDLYLNSSSECTRWGRRPVNLFIVAYPGQW
ncbi:3D domain-containing protein [Clostridium taeniosporum]|uniref:G5 domain-containing protein n=1 Tax=Clostridium taeniosporum TaxID=394958 RepID=A0A1D7XG15_9CLOT|nr:3D domain-containing protein [Clostridium taeniosporum]AOR22297.1 hypothetical protein BGI42_00455 [Clostridium taeniosporum]